MRAGLNEMRSFSKALYPDVQDVTFFESCGIADLVASSLGGRNRLVAFEYTKRQLTGTPCTFDQLEVREGGCVGVFFWGGVFFDVGGGGGGGCWGVIEVCVFHARVCGVAVQHPYSTLCHKSCPSTSCSPN